MSYETDEVRDVNLGRYTALKASTGQIKKLAQSWITEATSLHNDTTDAAEKTEVITVRDQLVSELSIILGV